MQKGYSFFGSKVVASFVMMIHVDLSALKVWASKDLLSKVGCDLLDHYFTFLSRFTFIGVCECGCVFFL